MTPADAYNKAVIFLKAHWFTIVAIGTILYATDKPYIDSFVQHHTWAAVVWSNLVAVWAWYQTAGSKQP